MCVLRHRSSIISLVFPLADEGSRVRVTVQEREREEEGMARMLEREEWSQQSQTYLRRIAEMETEGEECAEHLEGEIDRLLNKVSNDVCVCVCVCMCVCVCARALASLLRSFTFICIWVFGRRWRRRRTRLCVCLVRSLPSRSGRAQCEHLVMDSLLYEFSYVCVEVS